MQNGYYYRDNIFKEVRMDKIIEVDFNDRSIKEITKEDAHKHGTMHRAFSAVLYKGKSILIQRRAYDKYHCGGLWTNTCCSHPRWNEDLVLVYKCGHEKFNTIKYKYNERCVLNNVQKWYPLYG